jgi:DnaJ-class molecular chaperone
MCVNFEYDLGFIPQNEKEKKLQGRVLCPDCNGTGQVGTEKCAQCSGNGYKIASWNWTVTNRETINKKNNILYIF